MTTTNEYQKGAVAQCADNVNPNVRTSQWACITKIKANKTVDELYIFDDEDSRQRKFARGTFRDIPD